MEFFPLLTKILEIPSDKDFFTNLTEKLKEDNISIASIPPPSKNIDEQPQDDTTQKPCNFFPIYYFNKDTKKEEKYAVNSDDNTNTRKLKPNESIILSKIVSEKLNRSINDDIQTRLNNFVIKSTSFIRDTNISSIFDKFGFVVEALKEFYGGANSLDHLSIWRLFYTSGEDFFLGKQKIDSFPPETTSETTSETTEAVGGTKLKLTSKDTHFLVKFCKKFIDEKKFIHETHILKDIDHDLTNKDYLYEILGFSDNDIAIVMPIMPTLFDKNKEEIEEKYFNKINFIILYFSLKKYRSVLNNELLQTLSHKIYESFTICNSLVRKQLLNKLFLASVESKTADGFWHTAAREIGTRNTAEQCYIYLFSHNYQYLELKGSYSYLDKKAKQDTDPIKKIALNKKHEVNKFCEWITKEGNTSEAQSINEKVRDFLNNQNSKEPLRHFRDAGTKQHSMLFVPIAMGEENDSTKPSGLVLCTNRNCIIKEDHNDINYFFSEHNIELVQLVNSFLFTYNEKTRAMENLKGTFTKLNHETPSLSRFVSSNLRSIDQLVQENKIQWKDLDQRRYRSFINEIHYTVEKIQMLSRLIEADTFSRERIGREKLNLNVLLSAHIEQYKKEAYDKGMNLFFTLPSYQSDHYIRADPIISLALMNIVQNAIHYSYFGTSIHIDVTKEVNSGRHRITIENIGIQIFDKAAIFNEGERSEEAQYINVKGHRLGLYFVKKIMDAHENDIEVTNEKIADKNVFGISRVLECDKVNEYYHIDRHSMYLYEQQYDKISKQYPYLQKQNKKQEFITKYLKKQLPFEVYDTQLNKPIYYTKFTLYFK